MSLPDQVKLTPIDGWGFLETIDGHLAPTFAIEITEKGVQFSPRVIGWRGKALSGKYEGANLRFTPRNRPWSGIVVLSVQDPQSSIELFSGFADSDGLEPNWELPA